jgi:glucokinase
VGIICNGQLLRAGRYLHTEAGHILLNINDQQHLCGCGNYGCAEAYLSGANVTDWLRNMWQEPTLTGEQLASRSRKNEKRAKEVFAIYSHQLAAFLYSLCVQFCPEVVVLSGGFSHAADLFLPTTEARLKELLHSRRLSGHDLLPKILISKFQDEAGLLGAANIALRYGL